MVANGSVRAGFPWTRVIPEGMLGTPSGRCAVEVFSVVVVVLLVIALILLLIRLMRGPGPRHTPPGEWRSTEIDTGVVTLDLAVEDPDLPAVQRLVNDVARRTLRASPSLDEVEVRGRDGTVLGRVARPAPLPPPPAIPEALHEPRTARDRTPRPVGSGGGARRLPEPDREIDLTVPGQPIADRFDLPESVRRRVRDPERAIDVVRAILQAAGRPVRMEHGLVVTGDTAIAVVPPSPRAMSEALSDAFMRIQAADVARGVIVRLAYADPELVRHREVAAPHVRHVTADAIQRMADAVEAGGDPVEFAVAPLLLN
jgi:hypothetical protein